MAQVIIAVNQTAGALTLSQLSVPDAAIPASGQVTLTTWNTTTEIQEDVQLLAHIVATDVLLNVDGVLLTNVQSQNAMSTVLSVSAPTTNSLKSLDWYADQLDNPVNSDWTVNALAPVSADTNNAGLSVRRFDDAAEEGCGGTFTIPSGATQIVFSFHHRAETAPAAARVVASFFYFRVITAGGTPGAWGAGIQVANFDFGTNENWEVDTETFTLSALSLTEGLSYQFEFTRDPTPPSGTDLEGDYTLLRIQMDFQ